MTTESPTGPHSNRPEPTSLSGPSRQPSAAVRAHSKRRLPGGQQAAGEPSGAPRLAAYSPVVAAPNPAWRAVHGGAPAAAQSPVWRPLEHGYRLVPVEPI